MNFITSVIKKSARFVLNLLNINLQFSPVSKQDKYRTKVLNLLKTDLVIDVGANVGQYSNNLFKQGYTGNIISFEPVNDVYKKLLLNSEKYPKWFIYERCAIGNIEGEIEINVSENYESSSIFNVLEKSVAAEPSTHFIKKEKVKIFKLSDISELQNYERLHLKIDVQGYEEMVLKGAERIFNKISSLELEISLVPLYSGALLPEILLLKLKELGFVPVFYTSAFNNNITGAIMQLDGFFVKSEMESLIVDK